MSSTHSVFSALSYSISTLSVTVANGTRSPVCGQGNVFLPNNLTLRDVLYVVNFPVNLLSVNQFTKNHHCVVTLFPIYLLMQDLGTGRRIGSGSESDGLYCLNGRKETDASTYTSTTTKSSYLWHCHLGHPSLDKLKSLLLESVSVNNFQCKSCHLGKQRRSSYLPR